MNERTSSRRPGLFLLLCAAALIVGCCFTSSESSAGGGGVVDIRSDYSHMRVTTVGQERTLWFVRDNGEEVIETQIRLDRPYDLLIDYTKYMFLSYLVKPKQEKVLIVGLGGGSMIHFLKKYDPDVKIDVVEIDPKIVEVADKYFEIKPGGNLKIVVQDAFAYLKQTTEKYDVIYMDAFLKPSGSTDSTGAPLNQKTLQFYRSLHQKLNPGGMVVYNINPHRFMENDVTNIRESFPQSYVFELPHQNGLVVIGSTSKERIQRDKLREDAARTDARFKTSFRFSVMVGGLLK